MAQAKGIKLRMRVCWRRSNSLAQEVAAAEARWAEAGGREAPRPPLSGSLAALKLAVQEGATADAYAA